MEIDFLGTGSAFTMKNWQSNILITRNGKRLLIDAGGDIRWSLQEYGLSYKDIDAVYVSHAHADHTGGVEYLAFCSYFDPTYTETVPHDPIMADPYTNYEVKKKMKLFSERNLTYELWNHTLKGGMEGIEGIEANLETYFDVTPVEKNSSFVWEGIEFDLVQTMHVSAKYKIVDSYGLMFNDPDLTTRIYITTDCQFAPETSMKAYYKEADLVFHDCETAPFKSGVHSHYEDLRNLSSSIKGKMWLYHYQDNVVNDWDEWVKKVEGDGFAGIVKKGQTFPYPLNNLH